MKFEGILISFVVKLNVQTTEIQCNFIRKPRDSRFSLLVKTRINLTTEQKIDFQGHLRSTFVAIDSPHYDLRKHFFSARTVNIWNSLPNSTVDASTINAFKDRC